MVDRFPAIVVLALVVVALALTAATLSGAPWSNPSPGSGTGAQETPTQTDVAPNATDGGGLGIGASPPPAWTLGLLVVAFVGGIVAVVALSGGRLVPMMLGVLVPVAVLVVIILTVDPEPFARTAQNVSIQNVSEAFQGSEGSGNNTGSGTLSVLTYGLVAVVAVFAVGLVYAMSASVSEPEPEAETEEDDEPSDADIGAAAGAAADYIADAERDRSNAIYEAWLEMTDALSIPDPETTTPGEFAEAAVDAGMDPDDVGELTTLFEETRYGDSPPSEERESRALDALRRIEAAHSDVAGDATAGGDR